VVASPILVKIDFTPGSKNSRARSLHASTESHRSYSRTIRVHATSRETPDIAGGETMIQWVYERARLAERANRVIVATDDERNHKSRSGIRR